MKLLLLLLACTVTLGSAEFCSKTIKKTCGTTNFEGSPISCSASYSGVHRMIPSLSTYVHQHISHNFQYLLMSVNFANYKQSREGFSKLYRKLADASWEDGISLIKYITKRGGEMDFVSTFEKPKNNTFMMHELESLGRALDMQKSLAEAAHLIHSKVTKLHAEGSSTETPTEPPSNSPKAVHYHDAEAISFLENEFVHKHSETIRSLAGHTSDLHNLIKGTEDPSLSIFLFDEYLKSIV